MGGSSTAILRSVSNDAICRKLGIMAHHSEITLRRIQFDQQLMLKPIAHAQCLVVFFHKFDFEYEPQCDADGRLSFGVASP